MIERFTLSQRIQHLFLIIIIFMLILTGIPVKYHDFIFVKYLVALLGGVENRSALHRMFAVFLIGLCFVHLLYILLSENGNKDFRVILPRRKDVSDAFLMLRFYIGLSPHPPYFLKFNFWQKFQYVIVSFASCLMICSGLILWFENYTLILFPKWVLDVAIIVHGKQALLLFIIIFVLHLYDAHLNPDFFPVNKVFLTGKMSREDVKKFHSLEYEEITARERKG